MSTQKRPVEKVDSVTIRFVGDSGDGMQLVGSEFTWRGDRYCGRRNSAEAYSGDAGNRTERQEGGGGGAGLARARARGEGRGGRSRTAASYIPRYSQVAKLAGMDAEFGAVKGVHVVERYPGTGSTDFWGISFAFSSIDRKTMSGDELERELALMQAC